MKKRVFQILDDMNQEDTENGTKLVKVSTAFVEGKKVKAGALITMGTEEGSLIDLMNEKSMAIMLIVDKEEYFKRDKQSLTP